MISSVGMPLNVQIGILHAKIEELLVFERTVAVYLVAAHLEGCPRFGVREHDLHTHRINNLVHAIIEPNYAGL